MTPAPQSWNPSTLWLMIPVWRRPELTDLVVSYYSHIRARLIMEDLALRVLLVQSREDPTDHRTEHANGSWDQSSVEAPNSPLGTKLNTGARWIADRRPLGMMTIGSDDLVTIGYFRAVFAALKEGADLVALERCAFLQLSTWRLVEWAGDWTRLKQPSGVGRTMSGRLLAELDGKPWHRSQNTGLDSSNWGMVKRYVEANPDRVRIIPNSAECDALDIKSGENVWSFDRVAKSMQGSPANWRDERRVADWIRTRFGALAFRGLAAMPGCREWALDCAVDAPVRTEYAGNYDQVEVRLTVALPMWKSRGVAWMALEGLARQDHRWALPWELIVCEEEEEAVGFERLREWFEHRGQPAGCVRFVYIVPAKRWPLALKWARMGLDISESSAAFLLQAADCYPQPNRLRDSFDRMNMMRADWVQQKRGPFVDVTTGDVVLYDGDTYSHPCSLNMAIRSDLARQLPASTVRKGVDSWLYRTCEGIKRGPLNVAYIEGDELRGFDSHGMNHISTHRGGLIADRRAPFVDMGERVLDIPDDVRARLGLS